MYEIKLEQFSGPYDLLLELIESSDLDITEISLSKITEQFILYLESDNNINSGELSDFLVVASKLLLIKSRKILPQVDLPEDDEDSLERHLRLYKNFQDASKKIQTILNAQNISFAKIKPQLNFEAKFSPPENCSTQILQASFMSILGKIKPIVHLPKVLLERTVSLHERITHLRKILDTSSRIKFSSILDRAENKLDIILSFLALLELVNKHHVSIVQDNNFDEIMVEKL